MTEPTTIPDPDPLGRDRALALDHSDALAGFQDRFAPAPAGLIYLDGNSLGRLPTQTRSALHDAIDHQWGERLIRGWNDGWMELPHAVGDRLGEHLLGAAPGQTLLADSTTVCFYKLACAALDARPGRTEIVTDTDNFPTDRYVLQALAERHDLHITWIESDPRTGPTPEQVRQAVTETTALVTFSHTSYRSAYIADLPAITACAHQGGALALWDLSHSVGAVPLALDRDHVDLAVGCTYKYLNGGPGSPAFLYVSTRHHADLRQPIWGWLGSRDPFAMGPGYVAAAGIERMLSGTPSVLGLVAAQSGIELSVEAGIDAIRTKSTRLTDYAIELSDALLAPLGVTVGSPRDPARRGGHVALVHAEAETLVSRLAAEQGVIADYRGPDVIRVGLSPLTTRFTDVHDGLGRLRSLLRA